MGNKVTQAVEEIRSAMHQLNLFGRIIIGINCYFIFLFPKHRLFAFPFSTIQIHTSYKNQRQHDNRHRIHQINRHIDARNLKDKKMYVRRAWVFITQQFPYLPMPIYTNTVPPTIPKAQYHPRKYGPQQGNQICKAPSRHKPSEYIKEYKDRVEHKEQNIYYL